MASNPGGASLKKTTQKLPSFGGASLTRSTQKITPYKPAPNANNQSTFEDAAFKAQLAALQKAAANYQANMQLQKDRLGIDYEQASRDLGRQRERDLTNIKEDYAARGIVRSGVYGKRNDDYETEYNNQLANLARARDRGIQDLDVGYTNFNDEMGLNRASAIDAAIQRRLQEIKSGKYTTKAPAKSTAVLSPAKKTNINVVHGYTV